METSSRAVATARRNLAQRIERFLAKKRTEGPPLTADEATNVGEALSYLESERYPEGEDAMMLAEKGWTPRGEQAIAAEALAERLAELVRG